jgi:hypothetical protein
MHYTGTYTPSPVETSGVQLADDLSDLTEFLAKNAHDLWAQQRFADGWQYGALRDDVTKTHPCLIPYERLPDSEKLYDRLTAMETLRVIIKLGFSIVKV